MEQTGIGEYLCARAAYGVTDSAGTSRRSRCPHQGRCVQSYGKNMDTGRGVALAAMAEDQRHGSRADTGSTVQMWPRPVVSIQERT
jgi:hypothetical protein